MRPWRLATLLTALIALAGAATGPSPAFHRTSAAYSVGVSTADRRAVPMARHHTPRPPADVRPAPAAVVSSTLFPPPLPHSLFQRPPPFRA